MQRQQRRSTIRFGSLPRARDWSRATSHVMKTNSYTTPTQLVRVSVKTTRQPGQRLPTSSSDHEHAPPTSTLVRPLTMLSLSVNSSMALARTTRNRVLRLDCAWSWERISTSRSFGPIPARFVPSSTSNTIMMRMLADDSKVLACRLGMACICPPWERNDSA